MLIYYENILKGRDFIKLYSRDGIYTLDFLVYVTATGELPKAWGAWQYPTMLEADEKFREIYEKHFKTLIIEFPFVDISSPRLSALDVAEWRAKRLKKDKIKADIKTSNDKIIARLKAPKNPAVKP